MSETAVALASEQAGRYIYCVARGCQGASLGGVGLADSQVYSVMHQDLGALVHDCPAQPYRAPDGQMAAAWLLAHHRVVEAAWRRWGTVLPLAFNTIVKGEGDSPQERLVAWLEAEYPSLKGKLEALEGKAEYGVQVFCDPLALAMGVAQASREIRGLAEVADCQRRGLAYMYRQRMERLLKQEMEAKLAQEFRELYGRLSREAERVRVEKTRAGEDGRQMLMNLSCLVATERYPGLEAELDRVNNREGFSVRLVGPLPPYSFC